MPSDKTIDYVELPAADLDKVEAFYAAVFGWRFTDYGPEYRAFADGKLDGGFYRSELCSSTSTGAALIVLFADNLEVVHAQVLANGGTIHKDIFDFPGGRRFHFLDPHGNELAVWSTPTTAKVSLQDIYDAISFISVSNYDRGSGVLHKPSGQIFLISEMAGVDELAEYEEEHGELAPSDCVHLPHKHDLDLGRSLVFEFVEAHLPNDVERVENIFRRAGAYGHYKGLLTDRGLLDSWYDFEGERELCKVRKWCEANDIALAE
jgi:predicted enzyme related to lactoylglutathione lyase